MGWDCGRYESDTGYEYEYRPTKRVWTFSVAVVVVYSYISPTEAGMSVGGYCNRADLPAHHWPGRPDLYHQTRTTIANATHPVHLPPPPYHQKKVAYRGFPWRPVTHSCLRLNYGAPTPLHHLPRARLLYDIISEVIFRSRLIDVIFSHEHCLTSSTYPRQRRRRTVHIYAV